MYKFLLLLSFLFSTAHADLNIKGMITDDTLKNFNKEIKNLPIASTLYIYIDSEGGLVDSSFPIAAKMRSYKTICLAKKAMSAAMYIFQSCTVRAVMPKSELMTHNIQLQFEEKQMVDFGELKNYVEYVDWQNKLMIGTIAYRADYLPAIFQAIILNTNEKQLMSNGINAVNERFADLIVKNFKELKERFK